MDSIISRRRLIKIATTATGLAAGSALLNGCAGTASSGSAQSSAATASSQAAASTSSSGSYGHRGQGVPQYRSAMNKAAIIETAPDESEALAKFVVVSDLHLSFTYTDYIDRAKNMFEDIAEFCPDNDAIIVNGDLTDTASLSEYEKFAELAEASGFSYPEDFILVIGNHDQTDTSDGTRVPNLSNQFKEQAGIADQMHPYYDRTINGVHLIMMGPDHYPENGWDKFGISTEEIDWLDELVDEDLRNEQLSLVFLHEPLYQTVRNTEPGDWGHEWSLSDEDNYNLHDCVRKHPNVIFFTGHTHALPDIVQLETDEPLYVGTGSVAYCIDDVDDDSTGNADISVYGSLGWEVTIWTSCIRFRLRDFLKREYSQLGGAIYEF